MLIMTSSQALTSYNRMNGFEAIHQDGNTLGARFKKYVQDNAYYFAAAASFMTGAPLNTATVKLLLEGQAD